MGVVVARSVRGDQNGLKAGFDGRRQFRGVRLAKEV
jgi:hypothetical protein